jgi:hypothetical protein
VENGRVGVLCRRKGSISEASAIINQITVRRVTQDMVKRVNVCIQENGGQFQQLFMICISGFIAL